MGYLQPLMTSALLPFLQTPVRAAQEMLAAPALGACMPHGSRLPGLVPSARRPSSVTPHPACLFSGHPTFKDTDSGVHPVGGDGGAASKKRKKKRQNGASVADGGEKSSEKHSQRRPR